MRRLEPFAVYGVYLLIAVVITYPLITVIDSQMLGHPFGDAYEYTHHIWWIAHALRTGQDLFFMPNLVYPDGLAAPLLWSMPLQSFPAWLFAFVMPLPLAFNLSALLRLALNGWAMWLLLNHLLMGWHAKPAAFIGGVIFMTYPAFQGQIGAAHTGLLALWGAPLLVYALLRVTEHRRWIIFAALAFVTSVWGSTLLLIYLVAPMCAGVLLIYAARRQWIGLRRAVIALVLGGVMSLPFMIPLALDTLNTPPRLQEQGAVRYSAALAGVVSPSFNHPLYDEFAYNRAVLGVDPFEQASYLGIVTAILAFIGVIAHRHARVWLLVALAAWILSLGALLKPLDQPTSLQIDGYATHVSLPGAALQYLPLINIARTPARFNFAVGFAMAIMAGYGVFALSEWIGHVFRRGLARQTPTSSVSWRSSRPWRFLLSFGLVFLLTALIIFDHQWWWGVPTIPGVVPEPIRALANRDDIRAVLDVPFAHPLVNKDGMFLQTGHEQPMLIGQVSRRTPADPAKITLLERTLDPALLDAAGVDVIILHKEYDDALDGRLRTAFGTPYYEDERYAVFEVSPYSGDPPDLLTTTRAGDTIITTAELYIYTPSAGGAFVTGRVNANARAVSLLLDDTPLVTWTISGTQTLRVPVTLTPGYHTITLRLEPPCVTPTDPALECRAVQLEEFALEAFQPAP